MKRVEKLKIIEGLVEKFTTFSVFYLVDPMGLTVEQVNRFRKYCIKHNLVYQVAKNTFIKKAIQQSSHHEQYANEWIKVLKGASGIIFANANVSGALPAKMLKDFWAAEKWMLPLLKAASIEGDLFVGAEHIDKLSKIKSRDELLGDIMTLLKAPIIHIVVSLQSGKDRLVGAIQALSKVSA